MPGNSSSSSQTHWKVQLQQASRNRCEVFNHQSQQLSQHKEASENRCKVLNQLTRKKNQSLKSISELEGIAQDAILKDEERMGKIKRSGGQTEERIPTKKGIQSFRRRGKSKDLRAKHHRIARVGTNIQNRPMQFLCQSSTRRTDLQWVTARAFDRESQSAKRLDRKLLSRWSARHYVAKMKCSIFKKCADVPVAERSLESERRVNRSCQSRQSVNHYQSWSDAASNGLQVYSRELLTCLQKASVDIWTPSPKLGIYIYSNVKCKNYATQNTIDLSRNWGLSTWNGEAWNCMVSTVTGLVIFIHTTNMVVARTRSSNRRTHWIAKLRKQRLASSTLENRITSRRWSTGSDF